MAIGSHCYQTPVTKERGVAYLCCVCLWAYAAQLGRTHTQRPPWHLKKGGDHPDGGGALPEEQKMALSAQNCCIEQEGINFLIKQSITLSEGDEGQEVGHAGSFGSPCGEPQAADSHRM